MRPLLPLALLFGTACLTDLEFRRGEGSVCNASAPCAAGFYCDPDQRLCVAVAALAASCDRDAECASGFCATGRCCASACAGLCASCAVDGSEGSCVAVPAGEDPFDDCPGTTACDGERACEGRPAWSRRFGLFGDQRATALAAGPSTLAVAGTFENAISFGTTTLTATGPLAEDAFVAVLDLNGTPRWEEALGGSGVQLPTAVAVDPMGGVLVAGYHDGTLRIGATEVISDGADAFVASFDEAGALRWLFAPVLPGTQRADGLALDGGELVVVGSSDAGFFVDDCTVTASSTTAGVVLRLDDEGICRRGRSLGGTGAGQRLRAVAASNDAVYVAGESAGSFGLGAIVVEGGADRDVFVARLDGDDDVVWARLLRAEGDAGDDDAHAIAIDRLGRPWVAGTARDRLDDGATDLLVRGQGDAFLVALGADSPTLVDTAIFGDRYDDAALALAADPEGGMIVAGSFEASSPFGAEETRGGSDGFIARLAGASALRWSLPVGGLVDDHVAAVAPLPDGDLLIAATFGRTVTLGTNAHVAEGGTDVLVARLHP